MTKLDWDRVKQRRRPSGAQREKYQSEQRTWDSRVRQARLQEYVNAHELKCFKCQRGGERLWAKTGHKKTGHDVYHWAICLECRAKNDRNDKSD